MVNGHYMAGAAAQIDISRKNLEQKLEENEVMAVDSAYRDIKCVFKD